VRFSFFMSKSENVIDKFSGQMFLCDFGKNVAVHEGPGSIGPGGTNMSAPRMYAFNDWVTRNFVRDSLEKIFPDRKRSVHEVADPGEYGVESYWCRLLCCFVFMLSITQELDHLVNMAQLLWNVPAKNENWLSLNTHGWAADADQWLDHVTIKVAGMSVWWKLWNCLVVLFPKAFVFFLTANTGTTFLMESAGIDDMIINSVALGFLLTIDDLMTSAIQSASVKHILEKCEGYELYDAKEGQSLSEDEIIEKYSKPVDYRGFKIIGLIIPKKLAVVTLLTATFVGKYYVQHCDRHEGRWVSKPMHLPITNSWSLLNTVFPRILETNNLEPQPYWTYPR